MLGTRRAIEKRGNLVGQRLRGIGVPLCIFRIDTVCLHRAFGKYSIKAL